jgi:hypothetical protein
MTINFIAQALSSIAFGPEITFENLTMLPLLQNTSEAPGASHYLVLDDALMDGVVEITEVSEQGSVTELRVLNPRLCERCCRSWFGAWQSTR